MPGTTIQPPETAKWLLDLFTPYEEAESIHGDLMEEFWSLVLAKGPDDARRWYWRQCVKSVVHLFVGAFQRNPYRLVGAIVIGQLLFWLGFNPRWNLPADAVWRTLRFICNHVTPYHTDWYTYLMWHGIWLFCATLACGLLFCFVIGLLAAFIAKGGELVATICVSLNPFLFGVAILPFARYVSPHTHPTLVPMLLTVVEFPIMIVLGGWVVRDMRVASLRSRFTRNILNSA
jgi:hypothetical protein